MNIIKVSEFFSKEISPLILGGFFSRRLFTDDNKYVFIYTSYKESQKIATEKICYETYDDEYIRALNEESGLFPYWYKKNQIEEELGKCLLPNKCLFNEKNINYICYQNEGFRNINFGMLSVDSMRTDDTITKIMDDWTAYRENLFERLYLFQ